MNKQEIESRLGGYNDFPPEWKEITSHEFALSLHHQRVLKTEHRQMYPKENRRYSTAGFLIIFPDLTGVATTTVYRLTPDGSEYETKFWAFGCDHKYRQVEWDSKYGTQLRCQHLRRCTKCGQEEVIDSSD